MDPKQEEEKKQKQKQKQADTSGNNQTESESKDEMIKKGAVGRRFAVVDIPGATENK